MMLYVLSFISVYLLVFINPVMSELCIDPLGVEDGTIPSEQLTASSEWNARHGAHRGRLNTIANRGGIGAWTSKYINQNQWIQVDFGTSKKVRGIITQGRNACCPQWVTSYEVLRSFDGNSFETIRDASGQVTEFVGNSDQDTTVTNIFHTSVYAQFIRIHPTDWHRYISLRFEVLGCTELCIGPLGVEDGTVPSKQLTASSKYKTRNGTHRGRLNTIEINGEAGAWSSGDNNQNQWIQVDFGTSKKVRGIITQGRNACCPQWVTSYEVLRSFDGNIFEPITDASGQVAEFIGNSDPDTPVTNIFHTPVYAQFIRIHPTEWHNHISLRFEVLGCKELCIDPLGVQDGTIPSKQLTASSELEWTQPSHEAHRGRLNTIAESDGMGAWSSQYNDQNQWIQVDFGTSKKVRGVITQGRNGHYPPQWVTSYEVLHSFDGNSFEPIRDAGGQVTEFVGNSDQDITVTNIFHTHVYAQFIRIHPTEWHDHISLRFEVLGCTVQVKRVTHICWRRMRQNEDNLGLQYFEE